MFHVFKFFYFLLNFPIFKIQLKIFSFFFNKFYVSGIACSEQWYSLGLEFSKGSCVKGLFWEARGSPGVIGMLLIKRFQTYLGMTCFCQFLNLK